VRTFGIDQVAFVYGSRWKQRYFTRRGDDYFPLPAQWDCGEEQVASLSRGRRHRLVGSLLRTDKL